MPFTYQTEQWLPHPLERVFLFFADPQNLPRLLPRWQKARIDKASVVAPNQSGPASAAGRGTTLTLTFRPLPLCPIRLAWDAEITEFVWNDHFCDVQLKRGPFKSWRHCHTLHPQTRYGIHGTLLHDQIEYIPPLGLLAKPFVAFQLRNTFRYRQRRTAQLLSQPSPHQRPA